MRSQPLLEAEIEAPCVDGKRHPVRVAFYGWGEFEVVWNPCEGRLGEKGEPLPCQHWLNEPDRFESEEFVHLRRELVARLADLGSPAVPHLISALEDWHPDVRQASAKALGEIKDPSAIPHLIKALRYHDDSFLRALGDARNKALTPRLNRLFEVAEAFQNAREACTQALVQIGKPAVPHLIKALQHRDSNVRYASAKALGKIQDPSAISHLIKALEDRDAYVREASVEALGQLQARSAVLPLIKVLEKGGHIRRACAETLGKIRDPSATPYLIKALGDYRWSVRRACARALGKLKAPSAVPHLTRALKNKDARVRRASAEALGEIGDPQAVPHLIQALEDQGAHVRQASAEALGKIQDPSAVPHLVQALVDRHPFVRVAATEALGRIGEASALPALQEALNKATSKGEREAIQNAIDAIRRATEKPK